MSGWIKLHRKTLDNPIVCKDADYFATWIYLLLNATHDEYPALFKGEKITLIPGQLITGRKSISEKLKIDESKVQRILKTLEIEQQIKQRSSNKNRLITILNWEEYQKKEQQNEQQVNNNCTTNEQQVNTNKNVKNDKNVNNIYSVLNNYTSNDNLRQALKDFLEMRKKIKKPMTERAFDMFLKKLDELAATDDMKIKLIDQSILHNWQTVYPLKEQKQDKPQQKVKPNKFHNFTQHDHKPGELDAMADRKREEMIKKLKGENK